MLLYDDSYYEGCGFVVFHTRPPAIPRARAGLGSRFSVPLPRVRDIFRDIPGDSGRDIA